MAKMKDDMDLKNFTTTKLTVFSIQKVYKILINVYKKLCISLKAGFGKA